MGKIFSLIILTIIIISTGAGVTLYFNNNYFKTDKMDQNKKLSTTTAIEDLTITVVYDNNPYKEGLETGWGFSAVIKGMGKTILFDTGGDGKVLLSNMEKTDINPDEIDIVILSHIHSDHTGGLNGFLEKNPDVTVYGLKSFPPSFKKEVEAYGTKFIEIQKSSEIFKDVYSTGELGTGIKEQALVIQTDKGLIVMTGCAHPGIVNIIKKAKEVVEDEVLLVMGGFHLRDKTENELKNIISDFKELGVRFAGPCHCSGDLTRKLFEKEYGKNFINIGVGRKMSLEDL